MKNVLVVFNPDAGRKQAIKYKKIVQKFLLNSADKFKFVSVEEFENIDIEIFDTIFAMGGDGTVRKIVAKIVGTDKLLCIIPTGTANLLAAKLGMSQNIKKTLKIIQKNHIKKIDTMLINEYTSVLRCGFGYDADIICKTPQSLKNRFGYLSYFIAGIIFGLRLKPQKYEILLDNKTINIAATGIIVANSANMYRNMISLASDSALDDNKMDIFILKASNPITFFYEFLRIILGIRKTNSRAIYFHSANLTIKNKWILCHIDGEKTKIKGDINFKIMNKSVNVFAK